MLFRSDRLAFGKHERGLVVGCADHRDAQIVVVEPPLPLESLNAHDDAGGSGDAVDPALGGHREEEQRDHDPDRDRDVRDLDRDVLAELGRERRIAGAPPVPDDAPEDQAERQPSDQEPDDEEDRPEPAGRVGARKSVV